jgi:hypothetical protein
MQKVAEKYGVGHITSGEKEGKEVTKEIRNLPEKLMALRKMMNENEMQ